MSTLPHFEAGTRIPSDAELAAAKNSTKTPDTGSAAKLLPNNGIPPADWTWDAELGYYLDEKGQERGNEFWLSPETIAALPAEMRASKAPEPEAPARSVYSSHDGFVIDEETGEVVGIVDKPKDFAITNDAEAYWALERILQAEAALAATVLAEKAVVENYARMRAAEARKVAWLTDVFSDQLLAWAKPQFKGKEKSVKTPFGVVGFRALPGAGSVIIKDPVAAERWASEYDPDAVKVTREIKIKSLDGANVEFVKRVLAGDVKDEEVEMAAGIADAFEIKPAEEKGYINTGVPTK